MTNDQIIEKAYAAINLDRKPPNPDDNGFLMYDDELIAFANSIILQTIADSKSFPNLKFVKQDNNPTKQVPAIAKTKPKRKPRKPKAKVPQQEAAK